MREINLPRAVPAPVYRLRKTRHFYIESGEAKDYYHLEELKQVGFFKKRTVWRPVQVWFHTGMGGSKDAAIGDLAWARRIAKEFKLEVPE